MAGRDLLIGNQLALRRQRQLVEDQRGNVSDRGSMPAASSLSRVERIACRRCSQR